MKSRRADAAVFIVSIALHGLIQIKPPESLCAIVD
jgi:hypothetical protein